MCNRYLLSALEEARLALNAIIETPFNPAGEMVHPGDKGAVVRIRNGDRVLSGMTWGFPLTLKGKHGQPLKPKPVNNARTDKLSGPFWRASFEHRRCLIPMSAYAEAEGPRGSKTRTWFSLPDTAIFACAGVWRPSEEWGDCYSMIITDANKQAAPIHDRMPVIVAQEDWSTYLVGSSGEAFALCRPWRGDMVIERTEQRWTARH